MKTEEIKKRVILFSSIGAFILLLILIFINLISSYIFLRADLTFGGIYSLSRASKQIIRKLDEKVIIKAYFSRNLPVEYAANRDYLDDLLSEYSLSSKGKIKVEFIDPSENKETAAKAGAMGIGPIRFTQVQKDKYEVNEGYMGMALLYSDKSEVMPYIKSTDGIEYDITSKIKKLCSGSSKKIAFETGHGEGNIVKLENLYKMLWEQYDTAMINITEQSIPDDIEALIFFGPRVEFSDKAKSVIEQFLMRGKSVGFLVDSYLIDREEYRARDLQLGLENLFGHYGIKILPGFVLDTYCGRMTAETKQMQYSFSNVVEYPFYPVAVDFKKDNPIVKNMDYMIVPYDSPIEITEKEGLNISALIKSSPRSWNRTNIFSVDPFYKYLPNENDKKGPFNLAVAIEPKPGAKFKSLYSTQLSTHVVNFTPESDKLGRMFVISTTQIIFQYPELFMNIVDWLSQDEELSAIRTKAAALKPLKSTSALGRTLFKYMNVLLVPVLVVIAGFLRWRYRKIVMKRNKEIYG